MTPDLHLWLIPVLPLLGAAINGLFGKRFSRQTVAAWRCCSAARRLPWRCGRGPLLFAPTPHIE